MEEGRVLEDSFSEYHNYILIDNKGEAVGSYIDENGIEKFDWPLRQGKIVSHVFNGTYIFVHGDAKDAFVMLIRQDGYGNMDTLTRGKLFYFDGKFDAYVNTVFKRR